MTSYTITRMVRERNKGGFLTAHITEEPYGEIPKSFIHELGDHFTLIDGNNHRIRVKFNECIDHPLMTDHWLEVREKFQITGSRIMMFTYLGNNLFFVTVYYEDTMDLSRLPSMHTYNLNAEAERFTITLTNDAATGSELILNAHFAKHINRSKYDSVVLYGPRGCEYFCVVLKNNSHGKKTTRFRAEWKKFAELNNFIEGDTLRFNFIDKSNSNLIKVVKI